MSDSLPRRITEKATAEQELGRTWTQRHTGPVRYRRFTDVDGRGRPSIFIKIELPPGQIDAPPEIYNILREGRYLPIGSDHKTGKRTGLEFVRDPLHGRVWCLPNTHIGNTVADVIDARLAELAERMEQEQGPNR